MSLRRLFPELHQLMRAFDEPFAARLPSVFNAMGPSSALVHRPFVDFVETPKAYKIEAELPGVDKKDIRIEVPDNHTLVLEGKFERSQGEMGERISVDQSSASGQIQEGSNGANQQQPSYGTSASPLEHQTKIDESDGVVPTGAEKEERGKASKAMRKSVQHAMSAHERPVVWHSERLSGAFHRAFTFSSPIDAEKISASMKNGLLSVICPKATKSAPRRTHLRPGPAMSTPARRRLMRDFKRLQSDPPEGISGAPMDNNIMSWQAVIFGPEDTPWEGGTFKLSLNFTEDYPNKPPQVKFLSRMFHPNVYADGSICLDILQNQWSPIYDIAAILTSIQSLLSDPNPNSPANSEAARLFQENKREYNRRVKEVVERSWQLEEGAGAAAKPPA